MRKDKIIVAINAKTLKNRLVDIFGSKMRIIERRKKPLAQLTEKTPMLEKKRFFRSGKTAHNCAVKQKHD